MPNFPSIYLELQELWNSIKKINESGTKISGDAGGILFGTYPDGITKLVGINEQPVDIDYGVQIVSGSLILDPNYAADLYTIDNNGEVLSIFNTASVTASNNALLDTYPGDKYPFPDLTIGQNPQIKDKYHTVQISPGNDPDISSLNIVSGTQQVTSYITSSRNAISSSRELLLESERVIVGSSSYVPLFSQNEGFRVSKPGITSGGPFLSVVDGSPTDGSAVVLGMDHPFSGFVGTQKKYPFHILYNNNVQLIVTSSSEDTQPSNARIGVGTLTPQYNLHAVGTIRSDADVRVGQAVKTDDYDGPLITKQFDLFTAGNWGGGSIGASGYGSYGLYKDEGAVYLAYPNIGSPNYRGVALRSNNNLNNPQDTTSLLFAGHAGGKQGLFADVPFTKLDNNPLIATFQNNNYSYIRIKDTRGAGDASQIDFGINNDNRGFINSSKDIDLAVNSTPKLIIRSSGIETNSNTDLLINGGTVTLSNGASIYGGTNLSITGTGITFNAAELNKYETGTFTWAPSIGIYITNPNSGDAVRRTLLYTRIGNIVTISFALWSDYAAGRNLKIDAGSHLVLPYKASERIAFVLMQETKPLTSGISHIGDIGYAVIPWDSNRVYFPDALENWPLSDGGGYVIGNVTYRTGE